MNKLQKNTWFLLTLIYAVCVTFLALKHFVTTPWHTVGELGGDGAKNNFTYLWHAMWGKGYWFDGMNYPFGEHIVYTDGQPILSVLLTHFSNLTPSNALTALWYLIDLSYVVAIMYVYQILRHFKVGAPVALLFSGLIVVFSPQLFRIQGHYSLAYACIIPMIFYWMIRYHEQPRAKYPFLFFITGCIVSFLHPYYAVMMLIWMVSYSAGYFILIRGTAVQKLKTTLPLVGSIAGVFVVVAVIMKWTDPVKDRPASPMNNFYETCTRPRQVIMSLHSHIWTHITGKPLLYTIEEKSEGYAYVGVVVLLTMMVSFFMWLLKIVREKKYDIPAADTGFSPVWLFVGFSGLMFGMGIPFIWHVQWLDYISIFRQFRSLGRFTWIFYYIAAIYSVVVIYWLYNRLAEKRNFFAAYALLIISIGIWGYDAKGYIGYSRYRADYAMYNYDMIFSALDQNWPSWLQDNHRNKDDFQAILLLPFYHIGTEKLWVGSSEWIITLGTKAALQLHLPIIDVMMSRSSWSQAQGQVKIAAGPFADKPILREIKSSKPFLVLHFEEDSLSPDQKYILSASEFIGRHSQCNVYACYPDRLAANDKKNADSVHAILQNSTFNDTCIANGGTWYIDHFDTNPQSEKLFGPGSVRYKPDDTLALTTIPVRPDSANRMYEFSCWFLLSSKDYKSPAIRLQAADSSGKIFDTIYVNTGKSTDSRGMWFRASKYFTLKPGTRSVKCDLINAPKPSYLAMDEMMLRPADALIISKAADGSVLVNNHVFRQGKQ